MTNSSATTMTGTALPRNVAMLGPWPQLMNNPVRDYEWGSTTALARLQGRQPAGGPEAELWMGAHPSAPSRLVDPDALSAPTILDPTHPAGPVSPGCPAGALAGLPLDELVAARPLDLLGTDVHDRFGPRLPFLLKILAIAQPLSVQVHPDAARARAAFEGETDVPGEHCYVDPHPKPELLYALEPVDAMCGFRTAHQARRLLALVGDKRLTRLAESLRNGDGTGPASESERIEAAFQQLVSWPQDDRPGLVAEVVSGTRRLLAGAGPLTPESALTPDDRRALTWASRLSVQHPKDPLVAAPFILDLVRLEAGETLFVPAGAPHAYLYGLGVEIMANSDNVLRAGLTHKPVAVEELLHIVHGGSRPERHVPEQWVSPYEVMWSPGVPEFRLSRIWLHESVPVAAYPHLAGPQIVLCTAGTVRVGCPGHEVELTPGRSAFIGASGGPVTLTGPGEVFRAFAGVGRA